MRIFANFPCSSSLSFVVHSILSLWFIHRDNQLLFLIAHVELETSTIELHGKGTWNHLRGYQPGQPCDEDSVTMYGMWWEWWDKLSLDEHSTLQGAHYLEFRMSTLWSEKQHRAIWRSNSAAWYPFRMQGQELCCTLYVISGGHEHWNSRIGWLICPGSLMLILFDGSVCFCRI